ncbi:MAG: thiamine-phosphate kinase [Betaproteobacteria bacterium]|nr:thiamine-phosphate kinase [Betaproteobacteria bacterium]
MPSEFDLIRRFFTRPTRNTLLGVGDDAALVRPTPGTELAVSTDMLVAGKHFFPDVDPRQLGHKALAVNLSDMAAMGATPRWATLSLALPEADEDWLKGFAEGFFDLAERFSVDLIGGDTTRGPLNICVQIMGEVSTGMALRRSGAKPGDEIWVSGQLGDAALALAHLQRRIELAPEAAAACLPALHTPMPRVALGEALVGVAHGAIDISDGLLADLSHILEASGVAAEVNFPALPTSVFLQAHLHGEIVRGCLLAGGDDYELCFTAPLSRHEEVVAIARRLALPLTAIGVIREGSGLRLLDAAGTDMKIGATGFDHFAST